MGVQLGTSEGRGPRPTINITPLVDVVLVLLIIFMVVVPNVQEGVPVDMVRVKHGATPAEEDPGALNVALDGERALYLDDKPITHDALLASLKVSSSRPGAFVRLRADARLPFREVRALLGELKELGVEDVRFVVGVDRTTSGG